MVGHDGRRIKGSSRSSGVFSRNPVQRRKAAPPELRPWIHSLVEMEMKPDVQPSLVIKEENAMEECGSCLDQTGMELGFFKVETEEAAVAGGKAKEEASVPDLPPVDVKSECMDATSSWAPCTPPGVAEGDACGAAGPSPDSDTDDSDDWSQRSKVDMGKSMQRDTPGSLLKPLGGAVSSYREHEYAELLDFFIPFLQTRRCNQTLSRLDYEEELRSESARPAGSPHRNRLAPSPSGESRRSRSRSPRGRWPRGTSGSTERSNQEPGARPHRPESKLDECYHFALSLVPMLTALDRDGREEAKASILSMLHGFIPTPHPPATTSCPQ